VAPWVEVFIAEAAAFPNSRNDDQVDAMTQALNRLRTTSGSYSVPESQIVVNPFQISEAWPQAFGMAVTRNAVAALWGARDPGGTIYLHSEHLFHLPAVWNSPATDMRLKQRIVRILVEEIIADADDAVSAIVLLIHWTGGRHSELRMKKNATGRHSRCTNLETIEVLRRMSGRFPDDQIAAT
jgi:hypothetical protein